MKIMTFNVQHCKNYLTEEIDYELFGRTLCEIGADVVGINEIYGGGEGSRFGDQVARLAELGGYPYFTQWDPRGSKAEYEPYDTLLFQLTSDYDREGERVMFGDAGVCNFFIPAEKLKARDFSDILYTWDCG